MCSDTEHKILTWWLGPVVPDKPRGEAPDPRSGVSPRTAAIILEAALLFSWS